MIAKIYGAKGPRDGKKTSTFIHLFDPTPSCNPTVYYRLYTKDGPLESNNPLYYNYRYISRVSSKSVTPPHTAASLKRHICSSEGFKATEKCDLYLLLSEKNPVEDSTRIPLPGGDGSGPGMSESEPIALVIDVSVAEKRLSGKSTIAQVALPKWQGKQRHSTHQLFITCEGLLSLFSPNQYIIGFTTRAAKLRRQDPSTKTTSPWAALTSFVFRYLTQVLP